MSRNEVPTIEEGATVQEPRTKSTSIYVPFLQKIIAEIIGTYFLIFAGCMSITVNKMNGTITLPGIAITWGLTVMVMIYAVGHISGAHFNPAVTIAFASVQRLPWKQVPAYVVAQFIGAVLASGTLRLLFDGHLDHYSGTIPSGSVVQSLVIEIVVSFYLMFVISGVATDNRAVGQMAGLAVGSTVVLNVMISGSISGCSMNPARSLAPAIVENRWEAIWIYIIGPIGGMVAGAWTYNIIRFTSIHLSEITHMGEESGSMRKIARDAN